MQLSGQRVDTFIIVVDIKWPFMEVVPIYTGNKVYRFIFANL